MLGADIVPRGFATDDVEEAHEVAADFVRAEGPGLRNAAVARFRVAAACRTAEAAITGANGDIRADCVPLIGAAERIDGADELATPGVAASRREAGDAATVCVWGAARVLPKRALRNESASECKERGREEAWEIR